MFRRACVAQTLVLGRKRNVRRTKFCEKGKGRGRAAKHLHSVPKTKLVPKNSTKFLAASQWPARYQGRSTVKGQMGHVSTSFCVSKDNFDQFWEQTLKESKELAIEDPKLKRKKKYQ